MSPHHTSATRRKHRTNHGIGDCRQTQIHYEKICEILVGGVKKFFSRNTMLKGLMVCLTATAANVQAVVITVDNIDYDLYESDSTAWVYNGKEVYGNVVIPSVVENDGIKYKVIGIVSFAFDQNKNISSIVLPQSLKYINDDAFYDCTKLEKISGPTHIESLGSGAFTGTKFKKDGEAGNELFIFADWLLRYTPKAQTPTRFKIPEGIFGLAAYSLTSLNDTLVIPKSLGSVDPKALSSDLKHIVTGDNPVYAYKKGILFHEGTVEAYINSRTSEDEIEIDGMWIEFIFENAVNKGTLVIPGSVETAGGIVKPVGGVGRRGGLTGLNCEKLIVDEGVKFIGIHAFRYFLPVRYVDLPSTLINIEEWAFVKGNIDTLICRMPQPMEVPYNFIYYIKEFNSKVFVPQALLDTYKNTESYWKELPPENFYPIEGNIVSAKPAVKREDITIKAIYTPDGTRVNTLQRGTNMVKMSDGTVRKVMHK